MVENDDRSDVHGVPYDVARSLIEQQLSNLGDVKSFPYYEHAVAYIINGMSNREGGANILLDMINAHNRTSESTDENKIPVPTELEAAAATCSPAPVEQSQER